MPRLSEKKLASQLGATPKQVDRELRRFSRAARLLSSDHARLIDKHPKEWVALYDGKVQATAKTFHGLVSKLKKRGLPPNEAIIRYIDTSGRKLIL
jgi:IS30 family transposase